MDIYKLDRLTKAFFNFRLQISTIVEKVTRAEFFTTYFVCNFFTEF